MFDFGIGSMELLVVAVVALLVVGPKDLPRLLRAIGSMVGKVKAMAREFQGHLDEAMRETGLDEVRDNVGRMKEFSVADLDKEFSELEKEFRETAMPDKDAAPDTSWAEEAATDAAGKDGADDGDLLDESERRLPSLDDDATAEAADAASGAAGNAADDADAAGAAPAASGQAAKGAAAGKKPRRGADS